MSHLVLLFNIDPRHVVIAISDSPRASKYKSLFAFIYSNISVVGGKVCIVISSVTAPGVSVAVS